MCRCHPVRRAATLVLLCACAASAVNAQGYPSTQPATPRHPVARDTVPRDTVPPAQTDSTHRLQGVTVTGTPRTTRAVDVPPAVVNGIIFDGKTAEIVHVDSSESNTSRDVTRQILARIPGANVSELEAGGFPANGIGFRGLNPTQSLELNVRQNGVNISGDLYGYNEVYYSPPTELIDDIQVVRGASSLAYGQQFGGAVNYLLKHGTPNTAPVIEAHEAAGTFGLFDTFGSVSGDTGPLTYYAAVQHRGEQGERPNADYNQTDDYGRVDVQLSDATSVGLEYTRFRNQVHMPGGLTDQEFDASPETSERSRNWLATPWNILEGHIDSRLSSRVHLYGTSSLLLGQRYLVWLSEAGGPQEVDSINPATNQYAPREVDREKFYNITNEARLAISHDLFARANTLTIGAREFDGDMRRQGGGEGSTGSDFDMSLLAPYTTDLHFGTMNAAVFAEICCTSRIAGRSRPGSVPSGCGPRSLAWITAAPRTSRDSPRRASSRSAASAPNTRSAPRRRSTPIGRPRTGRSPTISSRHSAAPLASRPICRMAAAGTWISAGAAHRSRPHGQRHRLLAGLQQP